MRREPWLAEMCRRIEAGDEKLKRRLPIWTPHCAAFRDNHRAAADALKPLPRLMLDFDEKGHRPRYWSGHWPCRKRANGRCCWWRSR